MSFVTAFDPASLRLLATPINSPFIGSTVCNFAGTLYPVYSTFKALEQKTLSADKETKETDDLGKELSTWACYWAVFGGMKLLEGFTDPLLFWLPYYYPAKLGLLLWLQLPQFQGARHVYGHYMKPVLTRYQSKIEIILAHLKQSEWIIEAQRPYFQMIYTAAQLAQQNIVEFLKWFFAKDEKPKETIEVLHDSVKGRL